MSVMTHAGFDAAVAAAQNGGRLVAVTGVRGGCGATTLATSLAWMIGNGEAATGDAERCILVDLDMHFGSAAMALGVVPGDVLSAMLANPDGVDAESVKAGLLPVNDRFGMIAAQLPLGEAAPPSAASVTALMAALRSSARWVVADVPRGLDAASRQVLAAADEVVLVAPPGLEGLRDTRRMLIWLSALRMGPPSLVVVNGATEGRSEVGRRAFEAGIGQPVAAWIGAMDGPAAAAASHALPLAAVAGGKGGNPFAALAATVTSGAPMLRRSRLPAWWPKA